MSSRLKSAFVAAALGALALPASGQVQLGGLGEIDPFGVGFLEEGETAMPTNQWKASRTEDLLPLLGQVRTRQLTPSERTLLRRVMLSPAARPEGERADEVAAERARILYELGEAEAAADLLGRLDENPRGLNAAELSADLQMALGNEATACATLTSETREGPFWARLRAVCAVLRGDTAAAELAVELAITQGVDDEWFANAVFAASLDAPSDVPARFDTGLNLALSTEAGLQPPTNSISASRPDLAAAIARRDTIPIGIRIQAAGVAAEAGLIDGELHRQLYTQFVGQDGYQPARALEVAIQAADDPTTEALERARKLAMALRSSASNPARFAAAARLFEPDIARLGRNGETARYAPIFARAEIAVGDIDGAAAWLRTTELSDAPEVDAFDVAYLRGVMALAGQDLTDRQRIEISDAIVEAARNPVQTQQAARLFALWSARYVPPPASARALMAGASSESGTRGEDWRMLAIRAAAEADAAGEVVIATLALTRGDPSGTGTPDLVTILDALVKISASDAAEMLALEATGYWKASASQ